MIPRICSKIGKADDSSPEDVRGKWFFEMFLTQLGKGNDTSEMDSLGTFGPWDSEAIAQKESMTAVKLACEAIELKMTGEKSGSYIDLKSNLTRKWDRSDEN